ncbi:hypothetical protein PAXRUDRAFT_826514 [Paxillus rubicundulus Ve08.2h10]|uniref:Endoplasmic reticulum junction formation protein lunapark n=1 Tax=Paxillus rubicundulus Ve08.2h10 TaxID=930991 RepID=A0A0D0DEL8_9AGAM|nr:hypothetical protein PAXRUDRAFT_826514 [Paxillus rubicundulus Ve08.2h10]
MSFLSRWFGKGNSEDYETILSSLAADVQKRQTRLAEIRLRERRTTLQFTLGTFFLWFAYVSLWYTRTLPSTWRESGPGKVAILVGPILILFARRMMQIWYSWKGGREEKTLMEVLKKQRAKVEEIKKKTNYYSTRNLIEKYDEQLPLSSASTPLRKRDVPTPSAPQTPRAPPPPLQQQQQLQTPNGQTKGPPLQLSPTPQPIQAIRKQWYDKLADAILGDDGQSASVAASRYALICQKCFAHNGLVKESLWDDTQYLCPKCGFFNHSARSKKQAMPRAPSPPSVHSPDQSPQQPPPTYTNAAPSQPPQNEAKSASSRAPDAERDDAMRMDVE